MIACLVLFFLAIFISLYLVSFYHGPYPAAVGSILPTAVLYSYVIWVVYDIKKNKVRPK